MISRSRVSAFITDMNSLVEFFLARMSATFWTNLRGVFMVNLSKVLTTLPAYPRQQISKLTKPSVKHFFPQKTPGSHFKVDVLNENHVCLVAEKMASRIVKILASIRDLMVQPSYIPLCFLPVFRPFLSWCAFPCGGNLRGVAPLFARSPPLQHFKPTIGVLGKTERVQLGSCR